MSNAFYFGLLLWSKIKVCVVFWTVFDVIFTRCERCGKLCRLDDNWASCWRLLDWTRVVRVATSITTCRAAWWPAFSPTPLCSTPTNDPITLSVKNVKFQFIHRRSCTQIKLIFFFIHYYCHCKNIFVFNCCLFYVQNPARCVVYIELIHTTRAYMQEVFPVELKWLHEAAPRYFGLTDSTTSGVAVWDGVWLFIVSARCRTRRPWRPRRLWCVSLVFARTLTLLVHCSPLFSMAFDRSDSVVVAAAAIRNDNK